ncbi:TRAP transporter small permease subunit [Szabonella alba]|uniref:TRAP transporter small permease protein n=1 Tax=Szabonella alba TaxID=2804194 RepID=A0A8K0VDP8_9RHOB|nr:TRAP transporter small permease subunit [Szabonella alba]MBL4919206.1 TRAP transporter small permease subunit [Szabonella alba]
MTSGDIPDGKPDTGALLSEPGTPRLAAGIEVLVIRINEWIAPLWLLLIGVILANVIGRYVFHRGLVSLEEMQWHLYSAGFLFGLSYALVKDDHVRVDLLHGVMSRRVRLIIEIIGLVFFLLPLAAILFWYALPFVASSFRLGEDSNAPGGLPYRWIVKSFMAWGAGLLFLAGFARLLRCFAAFPGAGPPPSPDRTPGTPAPEK